MRAASCRACGKNEDDYDYDDDDDDDDAENDDDKDGDDDDDDDTPLFVCGKSWPACGGTDSQTRPGPVLRCRCT